MKTRRRLQFLPHLQLMLLGVAFAEVAVAVPLITDTDSFGVVYTLWSDGVNHGTAADLTYDLFITANTAGFGTSSHGVNYTDANAYINDISVLANAAPNNLSRTTGPGDITDLSLWTNITGGQNSNGCNGNGAKFDCAYSSAGGNQPPTGPGALMSSTMTNPNLGPGVLEWEFILHFATGTIDPLSFATNGSHLKVDYFGFDNTGAYNFIGQISDDVTINQPPPNRVPEPGSLALLSALAVGLGITKTLRRGDRPN
jgi:hypothetical protein